MGAQASERYESVQQTLDAVITKHDVNNRSYFFPPSIAGLLASWTPSSIPTITVMDAELKITLSTYLKCLYML